MSLFSSPDEHAANPPESWVVAKAGNKWSLSSSGGVLSTYATRHAAVTGKVEGFYVDLYHKETRWYAGESVAGWKPYATVSPRPGVKIMAISAQEIAEAARKYHYSVATDADLAVSGGDAYELSRSLFKAAIAAAYPDVNPQDVYAIWVDCNESVAYCEASFRKNGRI